MLENPANASLAVIGIPSPEEVTIKIYDVAPLGSETYNFIIGIVTPQGELPWQGRVNARKFECFMNVFQLSFLFLRVLIDL